MTAVLYYIHDPMCSWCWGYRPVWGALQRTLPTSVAVRYVVGGLAPDTDIPMPVELQQTIQKHWRNIQQKLGTEFNFDFWTANTPYRSTYLSCRAVIAARRQGFQFEMLAAIQRAYYLRALNPSKPDVLVRLVEELSEQNDTSSLNIDIAQFKTDLTSNDTEIQLNNEIALARELTHQGFPSLVFEQENLRTSITLDYHNHQISLAEIQRLIQ